MLSGSYDVCARCAGGSNAGHTIVVKRGGVESKFAFHLLPSGQCHISFFLCHVREHDIRDPGLVNPKCVGIIGSGVVVHLPSFFTELDILQAAGASHMFSCEPEAHNVYSAGLDFSNRIFVSDRAHLVFDFHQIVDGLKEVELGRSRHGFLLHLLL
jgi:adenylosuccinate synthase